MRPVYSFQTVARSTQYQFGRFQPGEYHFDSHPILSSSGAPTPSKVLLMLALLGGDTLSPLSFVADHLNPKFGLSHRKNKCGTEELLDRAKGLSYRNLAGMPGHNICRDNMNIEAAKKSIDHQFDHGLLQALQDFIRVPNQSPNFDSEWEMNGHMDAAMKVITDWIDVQGVTGLTYQIMREPKRTPLLLIDIPRSAHYTTDETVLMYGHMDKQPPLSQDDWAEGLSPYVPVTRGERLYGRGSADDGYAVFCSIAAVKVVQQQNLAHPRIIITIEACEESGSADFPYYMEKLTHFLGDVRLVVCLDTGGGNYDQLWLTTTLRGIAAGTLTVKILREGIHSGDASGVVPSSFRILRILLDRMEDSKSGEILIPELYQTIPSERMQQIHACAETLRDDVHNKVPFVRGAHPISGNHSELLGNRTWKPQLAVTGADGFPPTASAGNVMRAESSLKLSVRLPPGIDATMATEKMKEILERDPPYGAHVSFHPENPGNGKCLVVDAILTSSGWESPPLTPWLSESLQKSSRAFYNQPALLMGCGGAIPFMGMLGQRFPLAEFVVTGSSGPETNAHGDTF
ncbi:peptidase M20, partial [Planoprotostelium fungivorum]